MLVAKREIYSLVNQVNWLILEGKWDIAEIAARAHDLEDKVVGVLGMGSM